jgi:hypothetical protein
MADHAAAVEEPTPEPLLSRFGFALGVIGILLVTTAKLAPAGFLAALPGIVLSILGGGHAATTGRSPKLAIAGFFCALVAIILWLLARHDIGSVAFGRSAWPSWIF